ncbi:serine hydrolase domain-containing protein [Flavobacterium cerinum]|uniref:Beta-lactamase family protein n=1 Tax=Flavobacterium cerinum TaxID=2502784 RepID=A0ABY5IN90_9FLAO|nr:serine hydrolase domain-containing protein [Flavobacterium cerinum]UUC44084.1 beta-lactamase family protein [Flavobacterium cerinum]
MKKLILFWVIIMIGIPVNAQDYFKPIDSIIHHYKGRKTPGFSVLVSKNGKTLYHKHAGYANLKKEEKISDKTVFALASTSKQFTAACIVLLEKQGKLKFTDNLRHYIPEFPEYAEKITIDQLLHHTGGLKDYRALAMLRGENSDTYNAEAIKALLSVQELNSESGTQWSYSNSGYWCLVQIVEKVSGQAITTFAEENIFRPLKMTNTRYVIKPNNKVKKAAIGYQYDGNSYNSNDIDEFSVGGGSVYSTTKDLQKWLSEMETHRTFGTAFWTTMLTENPAKGKGFLYTKGLFHFKYNNHMMISHGGDLIGFHPITAYFPDDKVAVVILANDDDFERYTILDATVSQLLGEKYTYPKTEMPTEAKKKVIEEVITVPPALLESYTGNYELRSGYIIAITNERDLLKLTQLWDNVTAFIQPAKEVHHFTIGDISLTFGDFTKDKAMQLQIITSDENSVYKRTDKEPDLTLYTKYTGQFYNKALNATIVFFTENGILRYKWNDTISYIASPPESDDLFFTKHGKITFIKNETGTVTGFMLNHERALNMEFIKQ